MADLSKATDIELILEIYRRIKGETEMQQYLMMNDLKKN